MTIVAAWPSGAICCSPPPGSVGAGLRAQGASWTRPWRLDPAPQPVAMTGW